MGKLQFGVDRGLIRRKYTAASEPWYDSEWPKICSNVVGVADCYPLGTPDSPNVLFSGSHYGICVCVFKYYICMSL
jgi:hypothetical protein